MRKSFITLWLFSVSSFVAYGQEKNNHFFYFSNGGGIGSYKVSISGLTYVLKNKHSFQYQQFSGLKDPDYVPNDFESSGISNALPLVSDVPQDKFITHALLYGMIIPINADPTCRINLKGGLGISEYSNITNWQKLNNGPGLVASLNSWVYGNYLVDEVNRTTASLILNPTVEYTLTRVAGLSLGSYLQVNEISSNWGIHIQFIIGLLRGKK